MTGSLFLSPPTLLENSKVDAVYLHPFQCILFLPVHFSNQNLQKSVKDLLQAKEMDFCVMHGLFSLSVLICFSFLNERKDRVEGGSLCSFTPEQEEEVRLKEVLFIAEYSEYQEDHGETFSPPAWPVAQRGKRCSVTQDTSASFSQTFSFLLDFHFAQGKSR